MPFFRVSDAAADGNLVRAANIGFPYSMFPYPFVSRREPLPYIGHPGMRGTFWNILWYPWNNFFLELGIFSEFFGTFSGTFGAVFGTFETFLGILGSSLEHIGMFFETICNILDHRRSF